MTSEYLDRKMAIDASILRGLRVLLVEDNKVNQMVAIAGLKKLGVLYTLANDGLEALEAVEKESFDFILMDCQMPRMDGYEAARQIRARQILPNQTTNSQTNISQTHVNQSSPNLIPIIALTANCRDEDRTKCFSSGMDDMIAKPFNPTKLLFVVAAFLRDRNI
jgi:CheY-like chemotaxis protein